ncbi:hypothetical protein [Flagellimonas allohymeniacidonis]|uniref:Uncharacterized protein n=1 Tax=Flagellimonas allohymeniacidonis TaxID=2517819 RepID=A0A4Q8QIE0_9FLAO|nr:hypothetical protein [Allomuricauda hymeniacidonis]TAI48463.1 hypothetical protein EW142_01270 [Allomuricauda hymeniacidonis]
MKATKERASRRLWKTPRNQVTYQDCCGTEIVFRDLDAPDDPSVGDYATVDGIPAEGEYLMPDGKLLTFFDGVVTKIVEPSEESIAQAKRLMNQTKNKKRRLWKQRK